jgi:hypothetical protein
MKSKLTKQIPAAAALALIAVLTMATGAAAPPADNKSAVNPVTGLPSPPTIDPNTGLPLPPPQPPWKDPNWKDPDKVLPNVSFDGLPLSDIARYLREQFNDAFDVLIPNGWQDPNNPNVGPVEVVDPGSFCVKIQLKNVRASEVFNAMNLVFETQNTPLRWELKMNGNRPTALLRTLFPVSAHEATPKETKRMIYFVGELLGDEKSGGMTMEQLVKTVSEVYQLSYGDPHGVIQFHKEAQLLVVTGDYERIEFIQQTLAGLNKKVQLEHKSQPKTAEPKVKAEGQ